MTADQPIDGINSLVIAEDRSLRFEEKEENQLGKGGYGVVYRGTFDGNPVAVKIFKEHSSDEGKQKQKREMEEHLQLDHENVLKLLHVDDSRDKTCLVLELCAGTLTHCFAKDYKGPELPPDGLVLYQIANGLHYIHSRNLVHRDVKPDNILISMTTPVQMKLSDFGFVKKTSPRGTFTQSGVKGTQNWMAPEILKLMENMDDNIIELPRGTIQSDTFSAGLVFFFFLTRGKHPFGSNFFTIPVNILNNNPIEFNKHNQSSQGLYKLIGKMIKPKEKRISLPEVIEQLTANVIASGQFKRVDRLVSERGEDIDSSFHPKKPVIACGIKNEIIFFSAKNSAIPFSNWKTDGKKLKIGYLKGITNMEWNVDGTQLAAIANYQRVHDIIVWSYPSGEILFQKELNERMTRIEWNPFRPNVFAVFTKRISGKVFFFNSRPVEQRPFHFCTIESEKWIESFKRGKRITSFQWISANRVALGLNRDGEIEIWEIDESTTSAQIVKRFQHKGVTDWILDMAWDERTKCLAACSHDGWMTIWSMDSDQPIHATKVYVHCLSLAWRPNGKQTDDAGVDAARKSADNFILVRGLEDGKIVIWTPLDSNEKTRIFNQHSNSVHSLSFSPDGRFLASADSHGKLIIWSTENWEPVYIGEEEIWIDSHCISWLSSSTDVPDYKLTCDSSDGKAVVVEYVVDQ